MMCLWVCIKQKRPKIGVFIDVLAEREKLAFSMAGHTHGGQIAIANKAIFTPPGSGRFVAGWYMTPWGELYVSKGVGTSVLPMRIGARPEIAVFEMK